ncbi:hypothetical protein EWF20_06290 [Sulfolobus sp. S-194]|uniref:hypothetical protein n=1 Tax=Sulfolobus sp. S-194 TaxID=2512240 RepID=UPI0014372228|nr:hypothetical protein [Sulfolobus sp. S-194]QIW23802.1 hypothetical protein EWF20_06290 [Sulfolobus sp. S-194]
MNKEILKLYLTFWSGLLSGWVIDNFTGFDKPELIHELPIPDYTLLTHIIEENFIFALILFLIGNDMKTYYLTDIIKFLEEYKSQ